MVSTISLILTPQKDLGSSGEVQPDQTDSQRIALESLLEGLACVPVLVARVTALEAEVAALRAEKHNLKRAKQWYNLKEAAEALNCGQRKVRYYVKSGLLSRNLTSRIIQIPAKEVENFSGAVTRKR